MSEVKPSAPTGRSPVGTPEERLPVERPLRFDQRADEAVAVVLRSLTAVIEANLEGAIEGRDPEFLHDLRVAVRRSRAVQREFKRVFSPDPLRHFRNEFRWLQQLTGEPRDLDVYVLEFERMRDLVEPPFRADLDPLLETLRRRRLRARETMVQGLRSERYAALLRDWKGFLDGLRAAPEQAGADAGQPIGRLSGRRIRKVYRRMVRMGRRIEPSSPAGEYHELRKQGKELRYLLELFGAPLYPDEVVGPMVKALKALQDVLGRHQDREIQLATVRSAVGEVAALARGPAALVAIGVLVARLSDEAAAARLAFAERFARFSARPQRSVVMKTFA